MRQLRNIHVCTVSSRQKLRFISKQNNFQTETVYTFTMTTAQVNDFKAGETRGKLWGVTRMWPVRREDDECILLQLWKWIIEENMRAKKRHWVKRLRLSAFTTSQPRTFFWLWLMLVMWCYEYIIQFTVMVPSSSYYIIRTEIFAMQWYKAGITFLNWNQLWL